MPSTISCVFCYPVHSHLRRAPEGPEQVPHVLEPAQLLPGHGADVNAWDDNDKCTPLLAQFLLKHGAHTEAQDKYDERASKLRRIRRRVRKTISFQRDQLADHISSQSALQPPESRWSKRAGLHVVHCGPPFPSPLTWSLTLCPLQVVKMPH